MDEVRDTRDQLIQLLKEGGFNLRKWSSNERQLLEDLPEHMISPVSLTFTEASASKTLGLAWNPKQDEFIFSTTLKNKTESETNNKSSKRQILSDISTIFDPLGLLSPITIKAKILFQQIWKYKIEWDDTVPDEIEKEWRTLKTELTNMQPFKINRWLGLRANKNCELHAFCDASEKAFSCVVYSKITEGKQQQIALVAAKTKVAPIQKHQTLPRLELCGAHLLAQLVNKIKLCFDKPNIKVTAWTDSMIVLGWLKGDVSRWKAYVGHRVQEIISVVPAGSWKHVRSEQNPADCASRGLLPSQLHNFPLWFNGPEWLNSETIPETHDTIKMPEIELKSLGVAFHNNHVARPSAREDAAMDHPNMNDPAASKQLPNSPIEVPDTTTSNDKSCSEPQKAVTNNTKQRFKSSKISSSLLCILVTLLTLFQPTRQSSDGINVTPFEPNRGVYFDKIGNLQTVHDDWKIVTYYNMTTYWQGMENIHRVVKHLGERCEQFAYQTLCKTIMTEFEQELNELDHNNYMLETHHGQTRGRVTRGLVDGVGYLANSLFGVLDERFATQYKKDIETLHNNRDHLLNLIKSQTSIIEAHNNILKRNEEAMNSQFNLLEQHLNATENYLKKLNEAVQQDEALNYFNIMALTSSTILSKLRHIQQMLLDTAINIHHGHVDTRLLPQNQLFQELNIISGQLPQQLSLPVDNIQNQLADIYKLLEVKSRLFDKYFIIEITLPLTGDTPFTIYKTIPIPMIKNNNQSITMKTNSEYVAVNVRKETYMQLTNSDLEHCIKIEPRTYVCSLNKPTRNMRNHQIPCEIGAITNITLSKCIYTSESCNNKWITLQKPNTWLYVCCTDCQLQIICEGRMTTKAIRSTGILEAKKDA
ncbi:hypothetical protein HF086_016227 [Spodoptera exigua]|uniref:Uncharacterized protein n=1 Tax=Spodoptera exigua TaxID=7107 RepID=A0A922SGV9_SPOEX|nr:hypothetical protein HF086_016227 [Spodoptera exigua]